MSTGNNYQDVALTSLHTSLSQGQNTIATWIAGNLELKTPCRALCIGVIELKENGNGNKKGGAGASWVFRHVAG